jgi:hypothetical protein
MLSKTYEHDGPRRRGSVPRTVCDFRFPQDVRNLVSGLVNDHGAMVTLVASAAAMMDPEREPLWVYAPKASTKAPHALHLVVAVPLDEVEAAGGIELRVLNLLTRRGDPLRVGVPTTPRDPLQLDKWTKSELVSMCEAKGCGDRTQLKAELSAALSRTLFWNK